MCELLSVYLTTKETGHFLFSSKLTRKSQTLEINESINFTCRTSNVFLRKLYLSGMKYDVKPSKITMFSNVSRKVYLKEFSKNISIFVRPVIEQNKSAF